jgi:CRISPR-associated protein Cas1
VLLQGCGFEGTYREFVCKAYDEFWTEDRIKSYATYLVRQEKAVLENELKSWYPRRSLRKINSRARKIMTASFRGRSLFLSTVKWNEKNQVIGQLVGDELLSISKQWEIKHLQELAPNIAKKLKNDLRFDISKYSPGRGYKTEAPLFYGHDNSGELDVDSEICKFFRSREVKQKIYRVDLGLVEKTLVSGFPIAGVVNGSGNASGISASQKLVNIIDKQDASQKLNVRSSLVNRIDEKRSLISLSRRVPIFYVEHTKLLKGQECIRGQRKDADGVYQFDIPVASIGMMLVGPGVSITTEAARIAASRGCIIGFVGGSGLPMYAVATQHRSPLQKIKQINLVQDESARVKAGCYLLERRWDFIRKFGKVAYPRPPMLSGLSSVVEVMSAEAHWTKAYYRILAQHYKVQWRGKRALSVDGKNPLIFLNHLTYSLADMVILHLGFDPNIGILHGRTKGGGLAYDIADVVKPVLALELAFSVTNDVGLGVKLTDIKTHLFKRVVDTEAVDFLVSTLSSVFGCTHARSD